MNKEKYIKLCNEKNNIPIFLKSWWMDAICLDGEWDVKLVEENNQIIGALVYYIVNNKIITQPPLTQKNGIWISYPHNQKQVTRISYENKIIRNLINELEKENIHSYNQNFDYSFQNWYQFYWRGYSQTTRYTYVIEDLSDLSKVYEDFDSNLRKQIRKAEKIVTVKRGLNIEEFYKINKMTFDRQNMKIPYSLELLKRIDKECSSRKCREIFYAIDEEENINAAIYIIWDEEAAYYLMGGVNPDFIKNQATSLLMWEAIRYVSNYVNKFDFEGSMIENIEKFFRSFGGNYKAYFNIKKVYKHDYLREFAKYIYNMVRRK